VEGLRGLLAISEPDGEDSALTPLAAEGFVQYASCRLFKKFQMQGRRSPEE